LFVFDTFSPTFGRRLRGRTFLFFYGNFGSTFGRRLRGRTFMFVLDTFSPTFGRRLRGRIFLFVFDTFGPTFGWRFRGRTFLFVFDTFSPTFGRRFRGRIFLSVFDRCRRFCFIIINVFFSVVFLLFFYVSSPVFLFVCFFELVQLLSFLLLLLPARYFQNFSRHICCHRSDRLCRRHFH